MSLRLLRTHGPELFRVLLVSSLALCIDVGTLTLLTELVHIPYLLSSVCGFMAGLIVNYLLSVHWAFEKRSKSNQKTEFFLFCAIGLVGLGLNQILLFSLTEYAGLYYLLSKAISVFVVFGWNYGARKFFLFTVK